MIQVYNPGNQNYQKNGDITLMPSEASVHVVLNGTWQATLKHPIDEEGRWKYIREDAVVKMPSFNGEQLFRIVKKEKSETGVMATVVPIFFDARKDCMLMDVRPTEKTGQQALDIMTACNKKYSGKSDITLERTAYYQLKNLVEAINGEDDNSFINRWGGEILLDNYTITINRQIGGDYGVKLKYGRNISRDGFKESVDMQDVVTRIIPKAYNGYMMEGSEPWIDSELIDSYPVVRCAVMSFEDVRMRTDAKEDDAQNGIIVCDTQEELEKALTEKCKEQYAAGIDKPSVNIKVDIVLLQNTDLYEDIRELEQVSLGDTVHCRHNLLDIVTDARIIELKYDCIRKRVQSVVVGEFQYNYFKDVSSTINRVKEAIRPDGTVIGQQVQGIIDGVKALFKAQSSIAKKQDVRAIIFEDLDPESETYGAMCLGTLGFEIASERTADGRDWKWNTFGTGKGFFANFIVAGTMLADRIKGGTLELGGFNNQNGKIRILDAEEKEIGRWDKEGAYAIGKYTCDSSLNDKRVELFNGEISFSDKNGSKPIFVEYNKYPQHGSSIIIRAGGTYTSAKGSRLLLRIFENATYFDTDIVGPGLAGVTGRAQFSDGSYLDFKKGFLIGGCTTEGGAF